MGKITIVLGLGISGIAAAEFLLNKKALVLGIDSDRSLLMSCVEIRRLQALGLFVQHDSDPLDWDRVGLLVVSPGVSPTHPIYREAAAAGIPITGEAELALSALSPSGKRLVAVTGTNGKTTVALLVEHILN